MGDEIIYKPEAGAYFWILTIILLIILSPLIFLWWFAFVLVEVSVAVIMILAYVTTEYVLTNDRLIVKAFGIRQDVEYRKIISIVETKNITSSGAAFTRDKIEIIFNNKRGLTQITPKNREEFLRELKSRAPQAIYRNELASK